MLITSAGARDTEKAAQSLAGRFSAPRVFCIYGELGAGKTVFARGLARGYGYGGRVYSPTFTIMHEYESDPKIYHFDLYRISNEEELFEIGFFEYLDDAVTIIEWADKFERFMPRGAVRIYLSGAGDGRRTIEVIEP